LNIIATNFEASLALEDETEPLKHEIPAPIFRDLRRRRRRNFYSPIDKPQPQEEEKFFRKAGNFSDSFAVFFQPFLFTKFCPG
jgi:hypothetical protein